MVPTMNAWPALAKVAALDWANDIREKLKLPALSELEKGIPRDTRCCPLANTIKKDSNYDIEVSTMAIQIDGCGRAYFPALVGQFVILFDNMPHNNYPELIAPEGRFLR